MKRSTFCLIGLLSCRIGWSIEADQPLTQMNHRVWTAADGAPAALIESIAQTTDGTLWLGTNAGLYRFDGVRFVRFASSDPALDASSIDVLVAAADGGLWVGFRFGGIAFIKDAQAINYGVREGLPDGSVWKIVTDRSGTVWAALTRGLFSLRAGHWEETRSESGESLTPLGLAVDSAGTLWVTTRVGMLARPLGENHFRTVATFAHPNGHHNLMASAPDGSMWVFTSSDGLLRIDAPTDARPVGTRSLSAGRPTIFFFDSHGNFWFGSMPLRRMPPDTWKAAKEIEKTTSSLPPVRKDEELMLGTQVAAATSEFLEDHEGNVWVATPTALHCFSHSNILVVGLPEDLTATALAAGADGELWIAAGAYTNTGTLPGDAGALVEVRNAAITSRRSVPATGVFSAELWASDGSLWLGGPGGLTHMVGGQLLTTQLPEEARGLTVQAVVRDRTGAMWVSIVGKGLFRWADGQWTAYGGLATLPRAAPITEAVDADGVLWLGYTHARIARVDGADVRLFDVSDGLEVGNVTALYVSGTQLWAGGEFGLERFDGRRFVSLRASGGPFVGLTGIVVATTGELWTNGSQGIIRVAAAELARAIGDQAYPVKYATFDRLDGVPALASPLRPTPSAIEAGDGRLWFSVHGQTDYLVSIDPQRIRRNPVPPLVKIWTVRTGNNTYRASSALHLPARTTDLEVDYTGASYAIPERVHFRYRLEGFDREWQDVADRRQAYYTNLGPGSYTFRVTAANENDVWSTDGASLAITIQPAFYQTRWFYALCALTGLAILWALYWVRIRQVRNQVRGRLEERLIERERIARDLHDTLLQGVQGLILRFQVAADRIPRGGAARDLMDRALERADQVLEESRSRVKELRVPLGGGGELSETLTETAEPLSAAQSVPFSVAVEGLPRPLHPIVREEAYLIASEAITNAFRHASATKIEIGLSYGDAAFTVTIRDDGQGIDGSVLSAGGKPEHWGLLGMRERARRIRGQLTIQSVSSRGTEVQLRLPAEMAYQQRHGIPRAPWWRKVFRGAVTAVV